MQPSTAPPSLGRLELATPSGQLELLSCLPEPPIIQQALLFVHGAYCSASCFDAMLPLIARAGYACYALSLRGHGKSWQPGLLAFHAFTGISSYVADVEAALTFLAARHPDSDVVVAGHSMGGGVLQRALATRQTSQAPKIAGLVLLASAPVWGGGMDVARNWQAAEATLTAAQAAAAPPAPPQPWIPWLASFFTLNFNVPTGVETPAQVRNKFFSDQTPEEAVLAWIRKSKSRMESVRASIDIFRPLAEPGAVLAVISDESPPSGRKVLVISAGKDVLISGEASRKNFDAYLSVCKREEDVLAVDLPESAHHLMLDISRERCAEIIIAWLQGQSV